MVFLSLPGCQNHLRFTIDELPKLDSSTATLPIMQHTIQSLTDMPMDSIVANYPHSKTAWAYIGLMTGKNDIIFSFPPTEMIKEAARKEGVDLDWIPIAKDAFVFLVNSENPVNDLSIEEIQGIYQGNITNWNQVGGSDSLILPFQRNPDAGSQIVMKEIVMKGLEMIPPKSEELQSSMGTMNENVAYDNGINSIGYNFRFFVEEMDSTSSIKILDINGVKPSPKNILLDKYPFGGSICAIFRKGDDEKPQIKKVLDFLSSRKGKKMIKQAGYLPN